ncbi:alpha/beta fold hydrolase [Nonomuraea sp. FMUSA5-5]|uniref:Alpha/beta fold hydrolase n=1 Tax=Nonomuraea composti TaxID=2720023 RepID=A0ABX1BL69_9ACTN|nr:alpha/beta fold hydrolase [Nonomuraea sp. FMUSA5-5]NJP98484.1 alpha/beta fold hydrolase [Nonomuraea sp. FMUSA5-5]
MATEEDVELTVAGNVLRGRLFLPSEAGPHPLVVLQGGLGGPAESSYGNAAAFTAQGLACLVYDHRATGYSDGEPRQQFDPWQQCRDLRDILTLMILREDIDGDRIGLWGISIGGANAMFVAATDRRIKAVVAIIPPVSGWSARQLQPADTLAELEALIPVDRLKQAQGEPAMTIRLHGEASPGNPVMFSDHEGIEFVEKQIHHLPSFKNAITISTLDRLFEMEVRAYAERIEQPLLMILASKDTVAPVEEAREMFEGVPEPKELIEYPGQHYEILSNHYSEIISRSSTWIAKALSA